MFVILNVLPESDGKRRRRQRRPAISIERIKLDSIAPFFVMNCEKYRGIVPFNTISAMSGRLNNKFVLPKGMVIPNGIPMSRYVGCKLRNIMLMNTAAKILNEIELSDRPRSLAVIDKTGELVDVIGRLAVSVGNLRVLTEKSEKYTPVSEKLMNENGIKLTVSDEIYFSGNETVVISPDSSDVSPHFKGVIFTHSKRTPECSFGVCGEGADLSAYLKKELPLGTDSLEVAEALYSLCYAVKLEKSAFLQIKTGSEYCAYDEAAERIVKFLQGVCVGQR